MPAMKSILRQTHIHPHLLQVCVSSLALILSSAFCFADDCPPNTQATMPPNEETLDATTKAPYAQAVDMYNALLTLGYPPGTFTKYVLPDTTGLHAFNYWHTQNTLVSPSDCVSHQVITFLQANP